MRLTGIHRWCANGCLILCLAGCKTGAPERPPIQGPWGYVEFYFDPQIQFQPNARIYEVLDGKEQYADMVRFVGFQNAAGIRCSVGQHSFVLRAGTAGVLRATVNVESGKTTPIRVNTAIASGPPTPQRPSASAVWRLTVERPIAFVERH